MAARRDEPDERTRVDDADDAALTWEGDEEAGRSTSLTDPTSSSTPPPLFRSSREESGRKPVTAGQNTRQDTDLLNNGRRDRTRLVVTVLFGVVYLGWTVGWILGIQIAGSLLGATPNPVLAFVDRIGQFLALVSPALWFAAVLQLTAESRTRVRIGWLALGAGLLIPWPLLLGVIP